MNYVLVIFSSLLASSVNVFSETLHVEQDGISIDISLEPSSFTVGDVITLEINALTNGQKQLTLSDTESLGSFTIIDQYDLLDIPTTGGRSWHWSLQLDTFDASATFISDIALDWSDAAGNTGSINIDPLPVQIQSVAGTSLDEARLRDLKDAVPLYSKSNLVFGFWLIIGVALIVTAIIFLRKKPQPLSAHELAMHDLQILKDSNLDVLDFYTQLSDIVRRYLKGRFHIAATGQTTREFLIASKNSPHLEQDDRQSLSSFLLAADLVKFARFEPTNDACGNAIAQAEHFITATLPSTVKEAAEVAA